jgi:hypothetical protein
MQRYLQEFGAMPGKGRGWVGTVTIFSITHLKNGLSGHGGVMKRLKMLTFHLYALRFRRFMPCRLALNPDSYF